VLNFTPFLVLLLVVYLQIYAQPTTMILWLTNAMLLPNLCRYNSPSIVQH
jgi:hypothetical protein